MKGFLTKTSDGGVSANLTDEWGYTFALTGVPAEVDGRKGYAIECKMVGVPESLSLPGDEELFGLVVTKE
jgi:hypothetical protein